jgi:hypothetical protein
MASQHICKDAQGFRGQAHRQSKDACERPLTLQVTEEVADDPHGQQSMEHVVARRRKHGDELLGQVLLRQEELTSSTSTVHLALVGSRSPATCARAHRLQLRLERRSRQRLCKHGFQFSWLRAGAVHTQGKVQCPAAPQDKFQTRRPCASRACPRRKRPRCAARLDGVEAWVLDKWPQQFWRQVLKPVPDGSPSDILEDLKKIRSYT